MIPCIVLGVNLKEVKNEQSSNRPNNSRKNCHCSNRAFGCNLWSSRVEYIYGSGTCKFNYKYQYKGEREVKNDAHGCMSTLLYGSIVDSNLRKEASEISRTSYATRRGKNE